MPETPARAATRAAGTVNKAAQKLEDNGPLLDLEGTARALHAAEIAASEWAAAIEGLRSRAYGLLVEAGQQWNQTGVVFEGLPPLKCTLTNAKTIWDGPRAASLIAARCADQAVNRTTGEVMPVGAITQMVAEELDACMGFTPGKAWRKEALRSRLGEKLAGNLFDVEGGRATVRWVR